MTDEEARAWIASEFQRRVGDLGQARSVAQRTQEAVSLLQGLEQDGLISLSADVLETAQLADWVAQGVISELGKDEKDRLREEAIARARAEVATESRVRASVPELDLETRLAELARQSVRYIEQLKADHELTLPESDIAVAWVLTEVTKQGLRVTPDQLTNAVRAALELEGSESE